MHKKFNVFIPLKKCSVCRMTNHRKGDPRCDRIDRCARCLSKDHLIAETCSFTPHCHTHGAGHSSGSARCPINIKYRKFKRTEMENKETIEKITSSTPDEFKAAHRDIIKSQISNKNSYAKAVKKTTDPIPAANVDQASAFSIGYTIACIAEAHYPGSFQETLNEFCEDNEIPKYKVRTPKAEIIKSIAPKQFNPQDLCEENITTAENESLTEPNFSLPPPNFSLPPPISDHTPRKSNGPAKPTTSKRNLNLTPTSEQLNRSIDASSHVSEEDSQDTISLSSTLGSNIEVSLQAANSTPHGYTGTRDKDPATPTLTFQDKQNEYLLKSTETCPPRLCVKPSTRGKFRETDAKLKTRLKNITHRGKIKLGELAHLVALDRVLYGEPIHQPGVVATLDNAVFQFLSTQLRFENRYIPYIYDDKLDTKVPNVILSPLKKKFGL